MTFEIVILILFDGFLNNINRILAGGYEWIVTSS